MTNATVDADEMIQALGRSIGIDGLKLDPSGYCCLGFDSVIVNLERDRARGEFLLYAEIAPLPPDMSRDALLDMLQANHYGVMTGSGSIGIDRAAARVYLSDRMLIDGLNAKALGERLTQFVERAEGWQRHLAQGRNGREPVAEIPRRDEFLVFRG